VVCPPKTVTHLKGVKDGERPACTGSLDKNDESDLCESVERNQNTLSKRKTYTSTERKD